ncbi:MAG: hypothetical protein JWO38_7583 [Gemmataceae bacterium]|nr:hypothetical protein [Gemmataceae bacterium]
MPHVPSACRPGILFLVVTVVTSLPGRAGAQERVTLAEGFKAGHAYKVDVQTRMTGKLALPTEKGKPPQIVPISGMGRCTYDERILDPDELTNQKVVRAYREVEFKRVNGSVVQEAGVRPSVRRMVVIRSSDRRAPFSPDGPLTWGEIDVVRVNEFVPTLVPGLLPDAAVKPGQTWKATAAAVTELTDMEKIEEGGLTVEFVGPATVDGKQVARLRISGTVRGVNADGPNRQKLDGTAYFNLDSGLLTYLSIRGSHELLDGTSGQTVGVIEGQFIMTRSPLPQLPADLSDASLRGLGLKPDVENTLLLYDDPGLGVRFLYPRGWRVGAVQGKQVTLDHARLGGGILITLEPAAKVPSADDYLREVSAFLQKEKAQVTVVTKPVQVRADPFQLDRFTLDAVFEKETARIEYAVLKQAGGGAMVAARLPAATAAELRADVERVVRSMAVTKRIEEKK